MTEGRGTVPRWALSRQAFDRLLNVLDTDRERAALRYESIRLRLTKLFRWRGCPRPEELADRTFDVVARRVEEGVELTAADPYSYFHGVAVRVAHDFHRSPAREVQIFDDVAHRRRAAAPSAAETESADTGPRLDCLPGCLAALAPAQRRMFETYHGGERGARIRARQALAAEMGLPINALRIRVFRLRATLLACIRDCAKEPAATK